MAEPSCIDISTDGGADILRASQLTLNISPMNHEWTYFSLKTSQLEPTGIYDGGARGREELTEVAPGEYLDRSHWDESYLSHDEEGYEIPLPEKARVVTRWFSGRFVIFLNTSIYNQLKGAYSALHTKVADEAFRLDIENAAKNSLDA